MAPPPHLILSDPSHQRAFLPFPAGSVFSPDSSATSSSLSSCDSSSSSFTHSLPPDADPAPNILKKEEKQQQQHKLQNAELEGKVRHKNRAKLKQVTKSSSIEPLRKRKIASTRCSKGSSMWKSLCRCAGGFAADCAAVSCCPCAVLSLLAFILIELPSALTRKMVIHLRTRLHIKDATSDSSSRGRDKSLSIVTPTRSYSEMSEGDGEKRPVSIIRFSTQTLLEHFEAEHVGFGCLSQKRE